MSLDYPNRADWLAVVYKQQSMPRPRVIWRGGTYNVGMTALKAARYLRRQVKKRVRRAAKRAARTMASPS